MSNRITSRAISSLTLIIAGVAGNAISAESASQPEVTLGAATAINADLEALRMSEFASAQSLLNVADGHHSDSIGSHHHHSIEATGQSQSGDVGTSFDV